MRSTRTSSLPLPLRSTTRTFPSSRERASMETLRRDSTAGDAPSASAAARAASFALSGSGSSGWEPHAGSASRIAQIDAGLRGAARRARRARAPRSAPNGRSRRGGWSCRPSPPPLGRNPAGRGGSRRRGRSRRARGCRRRPGCWDGRRCRWRRGRRWPSRSTRGRLPPREAAGRGGGSAPASRSPRA